LQQTYSLNGEDLNTWRSGILEKNLTNDLTSP